jgi:hypothetical protein
MTNADRKALIKKLASHKAFPALTQYSDANRKWFLGKIIDFFEEQITLDSEMENSVTVILVAAGKAVNDRIKKGFSSGSLPNMWKDYDQLTSRTQIIFGVVAMNPKILVPANSDYFDFIVERRYRSIQRMAFFVNKNKDRKIFGYPSAKCGNTMKVNKDSATFWSSANSGTIPFILSDSGKKDPQTADDKLFTVNEDECDRNLFFCDPVATILHMDALREAKDADKLLKALLPVGDHYLKIDSPLGHFANFDNGQRLVGTTSAQVPATGTNVEITLSSVGQIVFFAKKPPSSADLKTDAFIPVDNTLWFMIVLGANHTEFHINGVNPVTKKIQVDNLVTQFDAGAKIYFIRQELPVYKTLTFHFVSDSRPENALFQQLNVTSNDFQVGDNVYVNNHPLYHIFYPSGAWSGEHSFIAEIGSRDTGDALFRTQLKVEGHGLSKTLVGMGSEMLEWINTILSRFQAITQMHLKNLQANGRKTVTNVNFIPQPSGQSFDFFEYRVPYKFSNYRRGGKSVDVTGGFVIKEDAQDPRDAFLIYNSESSDSNATPTTPQPKAVFRIAFTGPAFPTDQFKLSKWGVEYYNSRTMTFESVPLFKADNKTPNLLNFDDLIKSRPFFVTDDKADAFVSRPRVDLDNATYQTFLKNIGAIG